MENNIASDIIKIEKSLGNQDTLEQGASLEKLYEMVDYMYSYYLGLPHNYVPKNCITGDKDYFYNQLKNACEKAYSIDMIVAFMMESGVRLVLDELKKAADRGVKLRILTGRYLNITQPSALYLIKDALGDRVDLRLFDQNKSFHPKAYIFEYPFDGDIYLGSSNISLSALTSGIEWNYRINKIKNQKDYNYFKSIFEYLFNHYSIVMNDSELRKYSNSWKRPRVYDDVDKTEDNISQRVTIIKSTEGIVTPFIRPRGPQIEALYELKKTRAEGFDRGLVVAATGIGKTYLAAFDSMEYKKVLFVAHREEILEQAEESFRSVRPGIKTGYFTGWKKDEEWDILFATVQTIGQPKFLCSDFFSKCEFDYIIIDEFHHAAAGNYKNIIDYFTPKFLLGLTATPERLDNKDVFVLCHYNVVYEARLKDAINKGWLVPFRYFGVYDDTDYDKIEYKNGKYNEEELEKALMINRRAKLILNHYKKYNSRRAFGFCTSRSHASYMAKYFNENGVKSCAVISGPGLECSMDRKEAVEKLNNGEIKVIFSVDMFNEGLDVPSVDMVMFLRPTQSPTVFLQQLGRGLRKSGGKKYLTVLDFVGNYKKAFVIPLLLCGYHGKLEERIKRGCIPGEEEYPEDCIVDFDFRIIDIFKKQAQARTKLFELVREDYYRVKEYLGARPLRLDMFNYMDDDLYDAISNRSGLNIFNDYLGFLKSIGELAEEEQKLIDTKAYNFLKNMENTQMSRSYKMPLLLAFYNNGNLKLKVNGDDIYMSFKEFYSRGTNAADLLQDKAGQDYKSWGKKEYLTIAKNPIDAFMNTAGQYFKKEGEYFCFTESIGQFKDDKWFIQNLKDIIDYRTMRYYKTRIREKANDGMLKIKYALRDEKINILAMTHGNVPAKYSHQFILCKKSPIPQRRSLFLLDAKKSLAGYELSDEGKSYMDSLSGLDYELEYAAVVDCQLKIKISNELFEKAGSEGFFSIWKPDAPVKYFDGEKEGYLVVFRVYKLDCVVDGELLEKGRKGRNYFFGMDDTIYARTLHPVVDDMTFDEMKTGLIGLLKSNNWLIDRI